MYTTDAYETNERARGLVNFNQTQVEADNPSACTFIVLIPIKFGRTVNVNADRRQVINCSSCNQKRVHEILHNLLTRARITLGNVYTKKKRMYLISTHQITFNEFINKLSFVPHECAYPCLISTRSFGLRDGECFIRCVR